MLEELYEAGVAWSGRGFERGRIGTLMAMVWRVVWPGLPRFAG